PRPTLLTGPQVKLIPERYSDIADSFVAEFLDEALESKHSVPKTAIQIKAGYGLRSMLEREQLEFFFAPRKSLARTIKDRLLPFMVNAFRVSHVMALRLETEYQQAILSMAKIPFLIERYGLAETTALLDKGGTGQGPWDSILPTATDVGTYLDGLLFATPLA